MVWCGVGGVWREGRCGVARGLVDSASAPGGRRGSAIGRAMLGPQLPLW